MKILIQVVLSFLLVFFCGTKAFGQTIRKNYRELSNDEKQVFANALYALKQSGIIDEYANLHSQEFNQGIHNTEDFLPWHRWFIYYFEKALQNSGVAGANKIALPFWDWTSQYYNTVPTDREITAPLWDNAMLGQFNTAWALGRDLGGMASLPDLASVQQSYSIINFAAFSPSLERDHHNGVHMWIGGVAAGGTSPGDPAFYLHHNMVDKIWQKWTDLGRISTFSNATVPGFPSGVPNVDPNSIIDARHMKVWFAENKFVSLDNYTVSDTENYEYSDSIYARDFQVPASTNCTLLSGSDIKLHTGFIAKPGSHFVAKLIPQQTQVQVANAAFKKEESNSSGELTNDEIKVFPNPSSDLFQVMLVYDYALENASNNFSIQVFDVLGKVVYENRTPSRSGLFQINLADQAKGIYFLKISSINNTNSVKTLLLK